MKKNRFRMPFIKLLLFAAAASAMLFLSSSVSAYDSGVPFHVIIKGDGGASYTVDARAENNNSYVFYLPSSVDTSKLTVLFTGRGAVEYDAKDYTDGDTFVLNAENGAVGVRYRGGTVILRVMTGSSIPSVFIGLDGGNEAFSAVCADKTHEEPGTLLMTNTDGKTIYDGILEKFKGHGYTSFIPSIDTSFKNSYNIKLGEKAELIDGAGKIKKWVLLSPRMYDASRDSTGLSQLMAFSTFTGLTAGRSFGISGEYVDLYVNGDYRGVYILCERMNDGGAIDVADLDEQVTGEGPLETVRGRGGADDEAIALGIREYSYNKGTTPRDKDTDITGGYVLEVMCDMYEGCGFVTKNGVYFSIKTPEFCSREMVKYIASLVQNFENALFSETGYNDEGHHYSEYADMTSLADMTLVYAFYGNFEFFRTSTYIYKNADGKRHDKLTFGPVWDFETPAEAYEGDGTFFGTWCGFTYFVPQQYAWAEMMWQHGGFMEIMRTENERMKAALDKVFTDTEDTVKTASASFAMSSARWYAAPLDGKAQRYIKSVKGRYDDWFGRLWGDGYMLSLSVKTEFGEDGDVTMTASSGGGDDISCDWFILDESDPTKYESYESGTPSITVPADGKIYFCRADGKNNAFCPNASGRVFSSETVTMTSDPIRAEIKAPETEPADSAPGPAGTTGGCGSSLDITIVFAAAAAAAVINKKHISKRRRKWSTAK